MKLKWTIVGGSIIRFRTSVTNVSRYTITIPITSDDIRPQSVNNFNFAYVSIWGSDITGNGSRLKPWATIQKARNEVGGRLFIIVGSGVYYQTCTTSSSALQFTIIVGDGNVVFDGNNISDYNKYNIILNNFITYIFDQSISQTVVFIGITIRNYENVINHIRTTITNVSFTINVSYDNCLVEKCDRLQYPSLPSTGTFFVCRFTTFYDIKKLYVLHIPAAEVNEHESISIYKTSFIKCKGIGFLSFSCQPLLIII
jgi:hypothetical protein